MAHHVPGDITNNRSFAFYTRGQASGFGLLLHRDLAVTPWRA